ncbi:DUF1080 domain-containing protein [Polaribacter sp. WD7]|uniref:3-keto-disaccharide hydrolase n=1 Tax=Polaribacter sp. WD7 TaxID=2269061 RepID=UPI000DF1FDD1|nr:DUF1080 domain-containing protein [Polaribacter sp. WD7]RCS26678.1 DUF1080 domain-containing protein [Polaribacter sp. WD7]
MVSCKNHQDKTKEKSGFYPIFNGKNLEGWYGDVTYWSVKDGILTGEVTSETILKRNSFVIYEKEQPVNFELKLEYRISESGNSGVNYRSEKIEKIPFALRGYQSDIDGKNKYTGQNYEEKKRTTLAYIGEKVIIESMPDTISLANLRKNVKKNCWQTRNVVASLGDKKELKKSIKDTNWNTMHLIVKDNRMQHFVNGVLMSDVTDLDTKNRSNKGFIGVQVHVGPPMKVEYKNMYLKKH